MACPNKVTNNILFQRDVTPIKKSCGSATSVVPSTTSNDGVNKEVSTKPKPQEL